VSAGLACGIGALLSWTADLSVGYPLKAAVLLLAHQRLSSGDLHRHSSVEVGPANAVTLARGILVALVAALIGEHAAPHLWPAVAAALVALAMDGLDGHVARRTGTSSPYGARLDMELDALLTLALSVLVWQTGRAGAWVIASGAMRYAFVAAAVPLPWLNAPLPPRYRRKVVCVVQIGSLIVCLLPPLSPPLTTAVAAAGLAALTWSFTADVVWLWRRR